MNAVNISVNDQCAYFLLMIVWLMLLLVNNTSEWCKVLKMEDNSDDICTPPEIIEAAKNVSLNLLPAKSKQRYELQYANFITWCDSKHIKKFSESPLLAYFSELATTLKSSTLWSRYSMLRSVLIVRNDIDISKYKKLIAFLKRQAVGYKAKKSKTFTKSQIEEFLREAPDEVHLFRKVVLILGIAGACRRDELVKMEINDIEDKESIIIITIPDSKTNKPRIFTVGSNNSDPNAVTYLAFIRKYLALRPSHVTTPRLFLRYQNGKCINQVVGMNIFSKIPSDIANYLKLPDSKLYTGHCLRRTSATLLVNGGGDLLELKRHGGWRSSAVAEGYIDENIENKIQTANKILSINQKKTIKEAPNQNVLIENESDKILHNSINTILNKNVPAGSSFSFNNCNNCSFTFHINNNKN